MKSKIIVILSNSNIETLKTGMIYAHIINEKEISTNS